MIRPHLILIRLVPAPGANTRLAMSETDSGLTQDTVALLCPSLESPRLIFLSLELPISFIFMYPGAASDSLSCIIFPSLNMLCFLRLEPPSCLCLSFESPTFLRLSQEPRSSFCPSLLVQQPGFLRLNLELPISFGYSLGSPSPPSSKPEAAKLHSAFNLAWSRQTPSGSA